MPSQDGRDAEVWRLGEGAEPRKAHKERHRATEHMLLYVHYFAQNTTNFPHEFRRCFRMSSDVFRRIVHGIRDYADYFELKRDCTGLIGFSSI